MFAKKFVRFAPLGSKKEKAEKLRVNRVNKSTASLDDSSIIQMKTRIYAYGNTFLTALKGLSFPIGNKALFQIAIYMSLFLLILFAYFLLWLLMLLLEKHFLRWYDQPSVLPYLWYPSAELLEFRSTYPATKINGMPKLNLLIEKVKNNILLADERLTVVVDGSVLRNKPRPTNNYFQQLYNQANNSTYELSTSPCIQVSMYLHFGFHFWTSDTQVLYLQIPQTGEVSLYFTMPRLHCNDYCAVGETGI